jgi:GntR family transcriptional regulator
MSKMKRVQRRSGINRYYQLYTLILQALEEGSIKAGGALPTETVLMRQHAVSRNTVRRALGKLEQEKRIVRRRGSGSYAREQPGGPVVPLDLSVELKDLAQRAAPGSWRIFHFGYVSTPVHVLERAPSFGARSLLVQRSCAIRGRISTLVTSYVAERVGIKLNRRALLKRSLLLAVEDTGIKIANCEQATSAITANAIVANQLGVPIGSPLLYVERMSYADNQAPVEFAEMTFPAYLFRQCLTMRIDRSSGAPRWLPLNPGGNAGAAERPAAHRSLRPSKTPKAR